MFTKRTISVIKRELKEKLFSKSFLLMTFLIPVFMFGILGLQTFLLSYQGDKDTKIQVISGTVQIAQGVQNEVGSLEFIKNNYYKVSYSVLKKDDFKSYLNLNKKDLIDGKLNGIIYVPESALKDKKIEYYSKNPNNNTLFNKMRGAINKALINVYFGGKNVSESDISFASENLQFNGFRISKEDVKEEGYGNLILSFLFTFLLYFSLIFTGSMMMTSVIGEKNNRIVEVLLSSVNSKELMTGKIVGTAITAVLQMAIWLIPLIVLITTNLFILPEDLLLKLDLWQILYFLLNYFIGIVTFMGLYASVGSMFDNMQDAQSGQWPVLMLVMIPFFIAITMQNNPDNIINNVASLFPFASIIDMPARMTLIDVPGWEILISLLINILVMVSVFLLAGKIYRVGILMTGKKPKWSEIVRWLRYKY
jgi:ABC-2 type transport system permease protein